MNEMRHYGLLGYPLGHSFSKDYFSDKIREEGVCDVSFDYFEYPTIDGIRDRLDACGVSGFTVTIPYKEKIIAFLDEMHDEARRVGAVNVVRVDRTGDKTRWTGFNTDVIGFESSFAPLLPGRTVRRALVLGSGGAAKAVCHVLDKLGIGYVSISRRKSSDECLTYEDMDEKVMAEHNIIINATPVGMFPDVDACPDIPYRLIDDSFILYDLIYNPAMTQFLKKGAERGALVKGGLDMLYRQADAAWNIWMKG